MDGFNLLNKDYDHCSPLAMPVFVATRYLSSSFIFSPRSWRKRQEMFGCKMPEVLIANVSHRLLMRCNNEVTQWELSWIIDVWMHVVSRTQSNSIMHTRAEC